MPYRKPMARAKAATQWLDRLFLGGCVATYMVLVASVVAALRLYGG